MPEGEEQWRAREASSAEQDRVYCSAVCAGRRGLGRAKGRVEVEIPLAWEKECSFKKSTILSCVLEVTPARRAPF